MGKVVVNRHGRDEYKKHGYTVNQDWPGNMLWEELYNASPNAKVILTIRDCDEQWWESLIRFIKAERAALGNPGYWIMMKILDHEMMGPLFAATDWTAKHVMEWYLPNVFYWKRSRTWEASVHALEKDEIHIRQKYRSHIAYVKATVPKDDLLIWNPKDGWDPICKFLNKPLVTTPFPKVNVTGDGFLASEMADVMAFSFPFLKKNMILLLLKCILLVAAVIYCFWKML